MKLVKGSVRLAGTKVAQHADLLRVAKRRVSPFPTIFSATCAPLIIFIALASYRAKELDFIVLLLCHQIPPLQSLYNSLNCTREVKTRLYSFAQFDWRGCWNCGGGVIVSRAMCGAPITRRNSHGPKAASLPRHPAPSHYFWGLFLGGRGPVRVAIAGIFFSPVMRGSASIGRCSCSLRNKASNCFLLRFIRMPGMLKDYDFDFKSPCC